ncbi:MAG: stage II sporulation protein R [Bacillota bacterium]
MTAVLAAALVGAVGLVASVRPAFPGPHLAYNPYNLVRLHVLAASDLAEDQALKLRVRDAVIQFLSPRWGGVVETRGALAVLEANRAELARLLGDLVASAGKPYGVTVQVGYFPFPERTYGEVTLPAGTYPALRVILGEGAGQNWWCVLFPPLCFLDARVGAPGPALLTPAEAAFFLAAADGGQVSGVAGQPAGQEAVLGPLAGGQPCPRPEVRLFFLEWLRKRGVDPAVWVQRWRQDQARP